MQPAIIRPDIFVAATPISAGVAKPIEARGAAHGLLLDDVRSIVSCENYTQVALASGRRLLVRRTMQQWIGLLPDEQFFRVHRGLIINLDRIGPAERGPQQTTRVHLSGDFPADVLIKRRHWPALRRQLDCWRTARPRPTVAEKSIAVLPFVPFARDPADERISDGLSEELLAALAKVPGLRVAARTSAFYFKDRNVPISEIARQLGVRFLVSGSMRRHAGRIRLNVQLIKAADGFHVWSESFERDQTEVLACQDQIAEEIANQLQLRLDPASTLTPVTNPEAHWLVLEGRHFWNLRTVESFAAAERAFARALSLDPNCASAHAGIADVYVVRAMYRLADGEADAADELRRARNAAERALTVAPRMAEPHATLGFGCFHEGRFKEAEAHFKRAFALNPNYATAYQFHAWTLAGQGRLAEALQVYGEAIALDPLSFINIDRYAALLMLAGRPADALVASERAASLRPDVFVGNISQRAPILLAVGRREEAVATARAVRTTSRHQPFRRNSDADAIFVLRQAGFREEAIDYGAEVLAQIPRDNYLRGFVLSALGRFDEAVSSLRLTPPIMLPQLYWSAMWNDVRDSAAFVEFIVSLNRETEFRSACQARHE